MQLILSGKQIRLTEGIKGYIDEKLSRLEKYLNPDSEVKVTVSARKDRQKVEVTIIPISGPIIRAEEVQDDLYTAIDMVYDKLNRQIVRYKDRVKDRSQGGKSIRFEGIEQDNEEVNEETDIVIERRKKFNVKPMSEEEAILQMELIGHGFYMFRNQDTDEINLVYKRRSGGYGLIEQE
ncbi:ribosome hibernation-promoting factor, HPF/YfiA family [Asaccharospora irregularis]|uniref:Ribosome hibernation promoting factor n=1 Tax=Asaccharospora irregularis DSM 2635 TaxID=1121321 RepID=A0A1M5M5W4_9FIRM|nr:ribosome-associated translation inhibitor RaiA [Asaccharospora irregularis]SHG72734.1 SSU ribosomal protein S30P /sigma 54 modulation protein [Asaccharospora irregularis DSM 2635]